jgi:mono/diheme cytochrome c family protein
MLFTIATSTIFTAIPNLRSVVESKLHMILERKKLMATTRRITTSTYWIIMVPALLLLTTGCPTGTVGGGDTNFDNASAARGGALYDKWWAVNGAEEPSENHPRWTWQDTNTRSGSTTWRCKECHGWDYKGADGAYGESSSHFTGFTGIFETTLTNQEIFDKVKTDHGFGDAGLSDTDVWDLTKFVLEGQIDTDEIITATGNFSGDSGTGQARYENGLGTGTACSACHGSDGLQAPPGEDPATHEDFVGLVANENPWEFQHKIRFGQPGDTMPATAVDGGTLQDVADLGAYAQSLPSSLPQ